MKRTFTLLFLSLLFVGITTAQKNLQILLVEDNNKDTTITEKFKAAIDSSGYNFIEYNANANGLPTADTLSKFELVIWTTGKDASDNFWSGELANDEITTYLKNGGMLWLEGIDFMYDGFGSAPDTFKVGDFAYDYLGIKEYAAQAYYDDGKIGLPMMVVADGNGICTTDTVKWRWKTMWGADALVPTENATSVYQMGPSDYDFAGSLVLFIMKKIVQKYSQRLFVGMDFRLPKLE